MMEDNKKIVVLYIKDKMEHGKKIHQADCLGGEEPQERQGDRVLFELKNETGDGQVAHDLEELQALKELAQKAQSGIEGLADVFSGGCLQEEPKREVLEVVPHDPSSKASSEERPPRSSK